MNISVIVLAAGLSRRMGLENKLLLPFNEKTILETTIEQLLAAQIGPIFVVVGHEKELVKSILKQYDPLSVIENLDYKSGMTSSIQAGVRASMGNDFMICLSDMPLIQPNEYQRLRDSFIEIKKQDEYAIIQPIFNEKQGNPVIFSNFYGNLILNNENTEGCKPIVQAHKQHVYRVEMPSDSVLLDADTKEDYAKLLSRVVK